VGLSSLFGRGRRLETIESLDLLKRDVAPLEGTNISLWNTIIPTWWAQQGLSASQMWVPGDGRLAEQVWVSNRCIQLNSQQIAGMPLKFEGSTVPEWVSSPDSNMFPNGISDAVFAIVEQLYGWGFSCQYVTNYYADGYPRNWTVLDSSMLDISWRDGSRVYKYGEAELAPARIVQIDRNPTTDAHGCSALRAYAQIAWGLLAAGNQSMSLSQGAMPKVYLQPEQRQTKEQAADLQAQWMAAAQSRNGAPPVVPQKIAVKELNFDPKDLALLETQEFDARMIATAFGVPSVILNMALQGGLTYQNPAALGEMWWRFELRPTAKRIADAMTARLLPAGQFVWFDASDTFLPLDTTSEEDDPQAGATAPASPGPRLAAIGGTG